MTDKNWTLPLSATDYLTKLVACNTVSSTEAADDHATTELIDLLVDHLCANHMFCLKIEQAAGKFNLLALSLGALKRLKQSHKLGLMFSGHADTVPFNANAWDSNPLVLDKREGKLYGRGSVDMKGFLACAAALTGAQDKTLGTIGDHYAFSCLITSDEETSMDGAQMMSLITTKPLHSLGCSNAELIYHKDWAQKQAEHDLELKELLGLLAEDKEQGSLTYSVLKEGSWLNTAFIDKSFDLIVIGEPTNCQAVIAHKGWMARTLKVKGKTAHSSNPSLGQNAISMALPLMQELEEFKYELQTQHTDSRFAVPYVTLNMGKIQGGQAHNTVCDIVSLDFDVRPIPKFSNQQIQDRLQSIVDRYNALAAHSHNAMNTEQASADSAISKAGCFELTIPFADIDCFENTDPQALDLLTTAINNLQSAAKTTLPLSTDFQCVNYCTEASLLQKLGPCVVMGPGNIAQAHQENEYIECSQLDLCQQLLLALVEASA